jgi:ArsR family transcriptional regulator
MLFLVLHHVGDPARCLAEAARALKPGGRLVVVDMLPHERDEYRAQMGHVWLGFAEDDVVRTLRDAGFDHVRLLPLPADPKAKGPALFAARAVKPAAASRQSQPATRRSR